MQHAVFEVDYDKTSLLCYDETESYLGVGSLSVM